MLHHFTTHEEKQLVFKNRSAKGKAVSCRPITLSHACNLLMINSITLHVLVLVIDVGRTLEGIGTRLRDSVHATTDEVGLTNIEWRDNHLHFLDGIKRDRITITRKSSAQAEVVIEIGTVNCKVCHLTITTSQAHSISTIR